ncbi:MAG TPA: hypothetical protein VF590_25035 [Isosphaeraceae bacterium]|jgi:hypothetical protein
MAEGPEPSDPELSALAAALAGLAPARSRLDRDRTIYRAGQAAARPAVPTRGPWPALAAVLALVALGQAVRPANRPPAEVVERIVLVPAPAVDPIPAIASVPEPEPAPVVALAPPRADRGAGTGRTAYERLAGQVLRYGLDGLPPPLPAPEVPIAAVGPAHSGRWLRLEIESILNPGGPS